MGRKRGKERERERWELNRRATRDTNHASVPAYMSMDKYCPCMHNLATIICQYTVVDPKCGSSGLQYIASMMLFIIYNNITT